MADWEKVCWMCGDVGFPDKLFRCNHCRSRFQHFNYYSESAEPTEICDWCRRDDRRPTTASRNGGCSKKSSMSGNQENSFTNRSEYSSGDRIKQNNRQETLAKGGGSGGGAPSPRAATRRYKLLKDVMC
ncbi:PREDICTED: uncharacterized protein LOC104814079 isoform X2 [Tarenaya hassleriana]|uniref:uncharacterized protein LOC104814079 isoform X2 n=1 Tax=Tarenaya hassleriana TaxID=28532 RepID=UPI00053C3045|nr:PREDICTED: uncharacterized protein LOC104814079 isoform X2 [Tarenaya hassleriana]